MKNYLRVLAVAAVLATTACQQQTTPEAPEQPQQAPAPQVSEPAAPATGDEPMAKEYRGTVTFFKFEGGFYGIVCDDGQKFLPMGLPADYRQDGAIIEFTGAVEKDIMTVQQWGQPFRIKSVELIKAGKKIPHNQDQL